MRNVSFALLLAVLILALVSCPNPGGSGKTPPSASALGSLIIVLSQDMKPSNIKDMKVVSSYDVLGSGPGGATFQKPGIKDASVTIDSLVPGDWGVTVNGNNLNGMQVASASIQATVAAGQTASAKALLGSSSVGTGTFDVSLTWPAGNTVLPVTVTLSPQVGPPTVMQLAPTGTTYSAHVLKEVAAGYYTLSATYKDGAGFTWGGAQAVYITSGKATKLVFSPFDTIKVTIDPDISKITTIIFSGYRPNLGLGNDSMTITATPAQLSSTKDTFFSWYMNGVRLESENAPTITIKGYPKGSYRIDVVISLNAVLCSDDRVFTVAGGIQPVP
jgi:hypothetical protein